MALDSPESLKHGVHLSLEREVWETNGCMEFFHELQFRSREERGSPPWVSLVAPVSKLERKTLHFTITAVLAVFGE